MRIGITDSRRHKEYPDIEAWIHRVDPSVELVRLAYHLKNLDSMAEIDGLLLTGGGDVHPALYGMGHAIENVEEVNDLRDTFELNVIDRALESEIPILGICRGMQIMNVYLGGTLHVDLGSAGFSDHTHRDGVENRHRVNTRPDSLLAAITGSQNHEVNSLHHQAPDKLGNGLMVSATSEDGVIEAAEWILKDRMPFLLLVQWHPERMKEFHHPCSRNIAEHFLKEVKWFVHHKSAMTTTRQ